MNRTGTTRHGGTDSSGAGHVYLYGPTVKPQAGSGTGGSPMSSATERDKLDKERIAITVEEALKAKAVTVKGVDLRPFHNAIRHWCLRYQCTWGDKAQPVVRRGREISITLTLDRRFNKTQDNLFLIMSVEEDDTRPRKNLRTRFPVEEEGGTSREGESTTRQKDWWAEAEGLEGSEEVKVRVHIPGDCAVGYWHLKVLSKQRDAKDSYIFVCPQPIIILFNPWSEEDLVHFTDEPRLLEEYVLNDEGVVFMGASDSMRAKSWYYGQFDEKVVDICLALLKKAFNGKMTQDMGNPVLVSRALSRIVNAQDDNGVLIGNWSGDYEGGRSPGSWASSVSILKEFHETQKPVKYGQCWVFSHTLTTVCRALGLPCRSVTNFASAHDTDTTCTVDIYLDSDGDIIEDMGADSIWNFHVWNEVWILRPDLPDDLYKKGYDGWHVIDATPQELSLGLMQCGPCPVKAVKRGEIAVGFDTAFVFSEVNAEMVHWSKGEEGDFDVVSAIVSHNVGRKISSLLPKFMAPEGTEEDKVIRMDLTNTYKHPEGTEEERNAVKRAVRYCRHGSQLFKKSSELEVAFEPISKAMVGSPVQLMSRVTNTSSENKEVLVTLAARATNYWNFTQNSRLMGKENFEKTIKAGKTESFQLTVSPEQYMRMCDSQWSIHGFSCARDLKANMPYTAQKPFQLSLPSLHVQGPKSAKSEEAVTVTVSFKNNLYVPLTRCALMLEGSLLVAPDDPHKWMSTFGAQILYFGREFKVEPNKELKEDLRLMGKWEAEDEKDTKTMYIAFETLELGIVDGAFSLKKAA